MQSAVEGRLRQDKEARMLMRDAVSARGMGQNTAQATKLGVGKQQALTRWFCGCSKRLGQIS